MGESKPDNHASLADGLIMSLIQRSLSNIEIRATVGCGYSRINRIRKLMADPQRKKIVRKPPPHAVTEKQLNNLKNHIKSYETEDGFACAHRRARKFFVKQGLKWKGIYKSYEKLMKSQVPPARVLSRRR